MISIGVSIMYETYSDNLKFLNIYLIIFYLDPSEYQNKNMYVCMYILNYTMNSYINISKLIFIIPNLKSIILSLQ